MTSDTTVERLREKHSRLIAERDAYYGGDAPRGEIQSRITRRLEAELFSDGSGCRTERHGITDDRRLLRIWADIVLLYVEYDTAHRLRGDNYETRIVSLLETFGYPIPTRIVANVVGCSRGHARRYYWNDDVDGVREKKWSASQRDEQAPPQLVDDVLQRNGYGCVRCGERSQLIVHHIHPVSQDGRAEVPNLTALCSPCHDAAHGGAANTGEVVYDSVEEFRAWVQEEK